MPSNRLIRCLAGTSGSMGNIRPLIALVLAMRARGVDIMIT
jgi:hypothetical protein